MAERIAFLNAEYHRASIQNRRQSKNQACQIHICLYQQPCIICIASFCPKNIIRNRIKGLVPDIHPVYELAIHNSFDSKATSQVSKSQSSHRRQPTYRLIRIPIRLRMPLNILHRRIPFRITSYTCLPRFLVDPHIVHMHNSWESQILHPDLTSRMADPQIQDNRHWFLRDLSRFDVAILSDRSSIQDECRIFADKPRDFAFISARHIFEGVFLVLATVVPGVIQGGDCADGLLEGASAVRVHLCYRWVRESHEVAIGSIPDIEGCDW